MLAVAESARKPAADAAFRYRRLRLDETVVRLESGSAGDVDEALVRLALSEARARCELGRLAARFTAIRGYNRLGFSCLGDYSRERLGVSGREVQSFAFVAARLDERPSLARAFARGEISWSQTRLICAAPSRAFARPPEGRCAVADADSESAWLERARGLTVRELVGEVRAARACALGDVGEALDEASDSTEGEPRVQYTVACPARLTLFWRRALELARRMLGSQAAVWRAAEAIVAENCSVIAIEADEEVAAEEAASASRVVRSAVVGERAGGPPLSLDGLDAFGLDREMRARIVVLHSIDVELGAKLRRLVDLRLYRLLGFTSFDVYVRERIGISPAKARALVMVERKLRDVPELARAYRSGALSWVKALAILPVVGGPHASAWVTRAEEVMVRRLQDEVEWALDMQEGHARPPAPPETRTTLERPSLQTCAPFEHEVADRKVTFFGPASVVALFRAGVAARIGPGESQWKGFERLLLHAITEWEAQPRHRDPIFARDGWRCCGPGCSGRRSLEDHHIEFRSRGGSNEQWNRLAACNWHHHQGIHGYVVRASGRAPDEVTWELGLRPGQAPLMRVHCERYLPAL